MPEENRNDYNYNNNGVFGGLFGGNGCGCGNDNTILFFIIIFLLLFTSFGNGRG